MKRDDEGKLELITDEDAQKIILGIMRMEPDGLLEREIIRRSQIIGSWMNGALVDAAMVRCVRDGKVFANVPEGSDEITFTLAGKAP